MTEVVETITLMRSGMGYQSVCGAGEHPNRRPVTEGLCIGGIERKWPSKGREGERGRGHKGVKSERFTSEMENLER